MVRSYQRDEQREEGNGEKGTTSEPRGMERYKLSPIVVAQTVGAGRECSGRCCSEIPGDENRSGKDWSGSGIASSTNAFSRMV